MLLRRPPNGIWITIETTLQRAIRGLEPGTHTCLLYETAAEQLEAVTPFLLEGLRQGHHCLFIVDERDAGRQVRAVTRDHPEVRRAVREGSLRFPTQSESCLREGAFDPDAMLTMLETAVEDAESAGSHVLRAAGEMSSALGGEPGTERLLEYEHEVNSAPVAARAIFICQYDRRRFPAHVVRDVLLAHATVIVGGGVYDNAFYRRQDLLPLMLEPEQEVEWILARLEPRDPR